MAMNLTAMLNGQQYHFTLGFETAACLGTAIQDPAISRDGMAVDNPGLLAIKLLTVAGAEFHPEVDWGKMIRELPMREWPAVMDVATAICTQLEEEGERQGVVTRNVSEVGGVGGGMRVDEETGVVNMGPRRSIDVTSDAYVRAAGGRVL